MKNMAVIDKGGIVTNIIVCVDDFPEIPNKRIDITDTPWVRIGDPIDIEDPSVIVTETLEAREDEFVARLDRLDAQQIRPMATLYLLMKGKQETSVEDENILYMTEMQKQAYRNMRETLMKTPIRDWVKVVEDEYVRLTS